MRDRLIGLIRLISATYELLCEETSMMYKNLLVAYDGSEPSQGALNVAKNMIGDMPDAVMHILAVIPLGAVGVGVESPIEPIGSVQQIFPDMETYEALLANAKNNTAKSVEEQLDDQLDDLKCEVTIDVVAASKPAMGICEYAEDNEIDMIVMGRRGLGALRSMLGSVSYAVLHEANCPVVTVK